MLNESAQDKFRSLLFKKFEEAKDKNFRVSKRSFAKKLGISSGALSEIFNNKRPITKKFIEKSLHRVELSPKEISNIYKIINTNIFKSISIDQFSLISDDIHYGILSLMDTENFSRDTTWLSQKLKRSKKDTEDALDRLRELEFIYEEKAKLVKLNAPLHSPDEYSSLAIKNSHRQTLREASDALSEVELLMRDFTSLVLAIDSSSIPLFKDAIRNFRKEIMNINSKSKKKNVVYKLAIQLFPLSKLN